MNTSASSLNPFDEINIRLNAIEGYLINLVKAKPTAPPIADEWVDLNEAAKTVHLSPARLYVIHHQYFNTRKPGKRLLFSKNELQAYINGTLPRKKK